MIFLVRPPKPAELTDTEVAQRVAEFKATKKEVWLDDFIREPLFEMSKQKCAYCEACPTTQGGILYVEHFHHKDKYPDEVVDWANFLPACFTCNTNKGTFDTYAAITLINPCLENPQNHLFFSGDLLRGKTDMGKLTIKELGLNQPLPDKILNKRQWREIRSKIIAYYQDELAKLLSDFEKINAYKPTYKQKKSEFAKAMDIFHRFMQAINRKEPYTAFRASTLLHSDSDYWEIKPILEKNKLWTTELQALENALLGFALLKKKQQI